MYHKCVFEREGQQAETQDKNLYKCECVFVYVRVSVKMLSLQVSMCSGEAPMDQLVLSSLLYVLWWSSAWALGRALIYQRRLMDCFEVFRGLISPLFKKTPAMSRLHSSECQQNQLAGCVVRLHWQRHAHNLLPDSPLWSEARLFDGQIAADVGVYRGTAVFRLFCKQPVDLLLISVSWFVQKTTCLHRW